MMKSFLLVLPLVAFTVTEAFVLQAPPCLNTLLHNAIEVGEGEDALKRLQHDYRVLQEKLAADLVLKHDNVDAERVEEQMLQVLTEATKIQEHTQEEVIHQADEATMEAQKTRQRAWDLQQTEHGKSFDLVYEIDVAVDDMIRYSDYQELQAKSKKEAAQLLLDELKENEQRLQAALQQLRKEENAKQRNTEFEQDLHKQHQSFLDTVKGAILAHPDILVRLDPHIL